MKGAVAKFEYWSASVCPEKLTHTPAPDNYLEWSRWADEMQRTHTQHQCPTCGFWTQWVPKQSPQTPAQR